MLIIDKEDNGKVLIMFSCPVNIKIKLMGYALRNDLKPEKAITNILDDFFKNGDKK